MPRALWTKAPFALARHRIGLLAVVGAAFLVAVGAAAGPLMKAGAESEALQSKLNHLTPLAAGLMIDRPAGIAPGTVGAADASRLRAARALGRALPGVGHPVLTTTALGQLAAAASGNGNPLPIVLMARDGARAHVSRLAGDGRGLWLSTAVQQTGRVRVHAGGPATIIPPYPVISRARARLRVGAVYEQLDSDLANPYWINFIVRIRAPGVDASLPPTFALMSRAQLYRLAGKLGDSDNALANVYEFPLDTRSMTPARAKSIQQSFTGVERKLASRSALAQRLGCSYPGRPCHVSSALNAAVSLAATSTAGLRPVIDLLAGLCALVALAAALIAGVFTGRRRESEARLSLVRGEAGSAFFARAGLEALLPALVGAMAGLLFATALVRLFTPSGTIDSGVLSDATVRAAVSVVASVLAVAAGTSLARGRNAIAHPSRRRLIRVPWELGAAGAAAVAWLALTSGHGLVKDTHGGSHPRLALLVLPALVAAPVTGVATRVLRAFTARGRPAAIAPLLAMRRVAAARGLVVALTVTVAAGVASIGFAEILQASLSASSAEKALVANGSDVQGAVDQTRSVPRSFPFPVTTVVEAFDAGQLSSGKQLEAIGVDPSSLGRVLAAHWPGDVRSAVQRLRTSDARLPAIAVGVSPGRHVVTIGTERTTVDVVASVRAFPGMQPKEPLLVMPYRALADAPVEQLTYLWASGPPRLVTTALARSSLSPSYVTALEDFSRNPDVAGVTRTYGLLRVVALGVAALALVALMLYLNGRERSQVISSAFLRRMGLSQRRNALAVALEASCLVALATVTGILAAVVAAGAIVRHVDPLADNAPPPVTVIPWWTLLVSGTVVVAAGGLIAAVLTLAMRRSDLGEALRAA